VKECIANTTVISNFALIDRLDILEKIFSIVYITPEVREEMRRGIQEGYSFLDAALKHFKISRGRLRIVNFDSEEEQENFYKFCSKLHVGEASCLAIAKNRNIIFLTDDMAARKVAKSINVDLSGTIGVLVFAVKQKVISVEESDYLLKKMIKGNYRSPVSSISEFIKFLKNKN
jgi:predicted nucleic acid-binding protein